MASQSSNPNNKHISAQGGALKNGAEQDANEMWDIYLGEVKEDDERISDAWKDDSDGILVFTGLFAATVGAFILEFYKTLSPDSGNQTVALLGQISQQFSNFPNGTQSITATQPFSPSASMIWINAMWLISLVLSLTSALIATLLQQWARRYKTPHSPGEPTRNHRARVRSFLFYGTELYKMRIVVQIAPTLLHLSVYLFFAGLVVLFHTINKNVAIAVDVSVGVFAVAYIVLSILPCLDVSCPYRTPMSYILWYPLHVILSFAAFFLYWFVEQLHGCLVEPSLDNEYATSRQRILVRWLESRKKALKTHWQYIKDGLGKSIINRAIDTQGDGDRKIVARLFSLLASGDKSKLLKFAASIPRNKIIELVPLIKSGKIALREYLLTLLRNCARGTGVAEADEDVRKRSLLVCLDAIYHIAKDSSVRDLNFVEDFANIGLMRDLWDDSDTAIRFTSRSICALLAKQVFRGALGEQQLRWLHEVTGALGIYDSSPAERDRMNLKSFLYGVFSKQVDDLPIESFKETIAILLEVGNDANSDTIMSRLSEEVGWIQQQDPHGSRGMVDKLRSKFPHLLADSGDAPPTLNIMPAPTFLYPPAQPSTITAPFRSSPEHITSPDSVVFLSDSIVPFPEPRLTHSHVSNVSLGENVQPPPPPPRPRPVPSHYGVPFVNPGSRLAAPPTDVTIPSPAPQLTDFPVSNVPPRL